MGKLNNKSTAIADVDKELEKLMKEYVYGFACGRCDTGGSDGGDGKCPNCNGYGIVDWQTTKLAQAIKQMVATITEEAVLRHLEVVDDKLYDITTVDWGEPTKGSEKQWGKNHADLYVPTRDVHQVITDYIATLKNITINNDKE